MSRRSSTAVATLREARHEDRIWTLYKLYDLFGCGVLYHGLSVQCGIREQTKNTSKAALIAAALAS